MTVETKINKSGPYALDGVRLRFPRTFKLTDASHLRVIRVVDGVETDITGGYTQTGIGANVGEVVFTTATVPASGSLLLLRSVPLTQETDYANQARVQPEQIERDFDKQEMQIQDMQEQLGRAVKVSASVPNPDDINGPLVDALLRLNDSADNIDTVADHVDNVDTVASNIGAVVNVSDNMRSIVDASGSVLSLYDASYSATAGQNVFTLPHPATADQNVIVWVNRSRLVPGAAYSVDRDILTFSYGLGAEDQVDVLVVSAVSYQAVNNLYDEFQRGTVIYRTDFLTVSGQTLYTADSSGRPLNINPNSHILFGASPYSVLTQGVDYRVENGGYRLLFSPANGELFHSIAMPRVSNSQAQAILEAYKTDVEEFAERAEAAADRVDLGALDDAVSSASEDAQIASDASAAAGAARDQVLSQVISDIRVPTLADRPATGPSAGYVVYVIDSGISYRWTGTAWQDLGTGPLATNSALADEISARLSGDAANSVSILSLAREVEQRPTNSELERVFRPGMTIVPIVRDASGKPTLGVTADGKLWPPVATPDVVEAAVSVETSARVAAIETERQERDALLAMRPTNADLERFIRPGQDVAALARDAAGNIVQGIDRNGDLWPPVLKSDALELAPLLRPGQVVYPIVGDAAGNVIFGITKDGKRWPFESTPEPEPEPVASVEFVDPSTGVQPYMAIQSGEVIRYMDSAKWPTRMIGFEQRVINDQARAIAQTPDPALGIVSFGGGTTYVQTPGNDYPWHVLGADLLAAGDGLDAQRAAVEFLMASDAAHKPLYSVFALSEPIGSTLEVDALPGSSYRTSIKAKVAAAKASAAAFDKSLYIDRIHLSLLEGDRAISQPAADLHYAGVAQDLAMELGTEAEQGALPVVVITQSFGDRANGISNVALAEGRLHWGHWSLRMVCATPRYPFALVPDMPGLHTPEAALKIAELQNLAATTVLSGGKWSPPSLESATIAGNVITARFSSLTNGLELRDPANHGFALRGDAASISSVTIAGLLATITLSTAPTGTDLHLDYAYGQTGDPGDGYAANRGSITDGWTQPSRHGGDLYRYALSNRVQITGAA